MAGILGASWSESYGLGRSRNHARDGLRDCLLYDTGDCGTATVYQYLDEDDWQLAQCSVESNEDYYKGAKNQDRKVVNWQVIIWTLDGTFDNSCGCVNNYTTTEVNRRKDGKPIYRSSYGTGFSGAYYRDKR